MTDETYRILIRHLCVLSLFVKSLLAYKLHVGTDAKQGTRNGPLLAYKLHVGTDAKQGTRNGLRPFLCFSLFCSRVPIGVEPRKLQNKQKKISTKYIFS
jgi:hypothetical protein